MSRPRYLVIHHTTFTEDQQLTKLNNAHRRRGYDKSCYGHYSAYHFLLGRDGTVVQTRCLTERTMHTRNGTVNNSSLSIVLAGNFNEQEVTEPQKKALKELIQKLNRTYAFEKIMGHKHASPTQCPGKHLEEYLNNVLGIDSPDHQHEEGDEKWSVSRYYTPVRDQERYYRDSYEADFRVNCHGDCLSTASSYKLKPSDALKVAACPKTYPFGTKLEVEGYGTITCVDRGGAIISKEQCKAKGIPEDECYNRLDIWAGIGMDGLANIASTTGGIKTIKLIE